MISTLRIPLVAAVPTLAAGAALAQPELVTIDNTNPQMVKLSILLVVFLLLLFGARRVRLGEFVRGVATWLVIGAALVTLYTYRQPLEAMAREVAATVVPGLATRIGPGESVSVSRAWAGQFILSGTVDGAPVEFIFDTGASMVVLAATDAERAGFDPAALDYRIPVMTAAGETRVAPVRLDEVAIGGIRMTGVRAAVARPGELDHSLLGMTFLDRLGGYEVRRDRLVLHP